MPSHPLLENFSNSLDQRLAKKLAKRGDDKVTASRWAHFDLPQD
jgi:hypothetical protein